MQRLLWDFEPVLDVLESSLRKDVEPLQRLIWAAEDAMHCISWNQKHAALVDLMSNVIDLHLAGPGKYIVHLCLSVLVQGECAVRRTCRDACAYGVRGSGWTRKQRLPDDIAVVDVRE